MLAKFSKLWPFIWVVVFTGAAVYYGVQDKWLALALFLFFAVMWAWIFHRDMHSKDRERKREGIHPES